MQFSLDRNKTDALPGKLKQKRAFQDDPAFSNDPHSHPLFTITPRAPRNTVSSPNDGLKLTSNPPPTSLMPLSTVDSALPDTPSPALTAAPTHLPASDSEPKRKRFLSFFGRNATSNFPVAPQPSQHRSYSEEIQPRLISTHGKPDRRASISRLEQATSEQHHPLTKRNHRRVQAAQREPDRIDQPDQSNPLGMALHHDSPYEAAPKMTKSNQLAVNFPQPSKGGFKRHQAESRPFQTRRVSPPHQFPNNAFIHPPMPGPLNLLPGQILPPNFQYLDVQIEHGPILKHSHRRTRPHFDVQPQQRFSSSATDLYPRDAGNKLSHSKSGSSLSVSDAGLSVKQYSPNAPPLYAAGRRSPSPLGNSLSHRSQERLHEHDQPIHHLPDGGRSTHPHISPRSSSQGLSAETKMEAAESIPNENGPREFQRFGSISPRLGDAAFSKPEDISNASSRENVNSEQVSGHKQPRGALVTHTKSELVGGDSGAVPETPPQGRVKPDNKSTSWTGKLFKRMVTFKKTTPRAQKDTKTVSGGRSVPPINDRNARSSSPSSQSTSVSSRSDHQPEVRTATFPASSVEEEISVEAAAPNADQSSASAPGPFNNHARQSSGEASSPTSMTSQESVKVRGISRGPLFASARPLTPGLDVGVEFEKPPRFVPVQPQAGPSQTSRRPTTTERRASHQPRPAVLEVPWIENGSMRHSSYETLLVQPQPISGQRPRLEMRQLASRSVEFEQSDVRLLDSAPRLYPSKQISSSPSRLYHSSDSAWHETPQISQSIPQPQQPPLHNGGAGAPRPSSQMIQQISHRNVSYGTTSKPPRRVPTHLVMPTPLKQSSAPVNPPYNGYQAQGSSARHFTTPAFRQHQRTGYLQDETPFHPSSLQNPVYSPRAQDIPMVHGDHRLTRKKGGSDLPPPRNPLPTVPHPADGGHLTPAPIPGPKTKRKTLIKQNMNTRPRLIQ